MKQIKKILPIIFFPFLLLYSCSGNNNAAINKDSTSSPTSSTENAKGNASFSCKIDGRVFSGNGSSSYANAAIKSSPGIINFILVPMKSDQRGVPEQMNFFIADKGTTIIHKDNNGSYSLDYSPGDGNDDLTCKQITVTITSSDASGVKGTFSGVYTNPKYNDKEVPITDGVFNIPWSK